MNAKCLIKIARIPPNSPEFHQEFRFVGIFLPANKLCPAVTIANKLQQLAERNKTLTFVYLSTAPGWAHAKVATCVGKPEKTD